MPLHSEGLLLHLSTSDVARPQRLLTLNVINCGTVWSMHHLGTCMDDSEATARWLRASLRHIRQMWLHSRKSLSSIVLQNWTTSWFAPWFTSCRSCCTIVHTSKLIWVDLGAYIQMVVFTNVTALTWLKFDMLAKIRVLEPYLHMPRDRSLPAFGYSILLSLFSVMKCNSFTPLPFFRSCPVPATKYTTICNPFALGYALQSFLVRLVQMLLESSLAWVEVNLTQQWSIAGGQCHILWDYRAVITIIKGCLAN